MTEDTIIRACQEGDVGAFKQVYDLYGQQLLRTAMKMLGHQEDAEDAVQMTFLRLYRGIRNFRFESQFGTYITRILMNVCFEQMKKRKKAELQVVREIDRPHQPGDDLRMQLEEAINQLPDQQRACFVLFAIEDRKQAEIADILGLSLGGVKANIYHAKNRLRTLLSDIQTDLSNGLAGESA